MLGIADYYYFSYHHVDTRFGATGSKSLDVASRRINRLRDPVVRICNVIL